MSLKFSRLTRQAMKALAPNQELCEHGIRFRRLLNGDGKFTLNLMIYGQRVHRLLGYESEGWTVSKALEAVEQAKTDARHQRLNLPKGRTLDWTFVRAADQFIERLKAVNGKNIAYKEAVLKLQLKPFFGNTLLAKVDTFAIERYRKKRKAEGVTPATINREISVLNNLYTMAIEWRWVDRKPYSIRKLPEGSGRTVYLTDEQAERLLEAAATQTRSRLLHAFITIGLNTGMRVQEILSIRKEHVALERREIYIPKAKAGADTQIISEQLADYLRTYMASLPTDTVWLFPAPNRQSRGDRRATNLRESYKRAVERAGLTPGQVVMHTLRHTFGTNLERTGAHLSTRMRLLRHKSPAMTMRYTHTSGAQLMAAMDKLGQKLHPLRTDYGERSSVQDGQG